MAGSSCIGSDMPFFCLLNLLLLSDSDISVEVCREDKKYSADMDGRYICSIDYE